MKAISKLISVVLILALCLSIFTISAFAEEKPVVVIGDTLDLTDDNTEKTDPVIPVDSENPPEDKKADAPADGSVKVAVFDELDAALKAHAPAITLTAKVPVTGPLTLDYAVKLNLGGTGCGLDFSGAGAAAVVSAAEGVELTNGNLFVTNAESFDKDGNAVGGFQNVAVGNVKMTGVHIWNFVGEGSLFGEGVNFVSGTTSKALHEGDVAEEGRFIYEVKQEIPEEDKKDEEKKDENLTDPADPKPTDPADPQPTDPADLQPTDPADPKPTDPADPQPTDPVDPQPTDPVDPKSETQEAVIEASISPEPQTAEVAEQPSEPPVNEDPVTIEKPEEVVLEEEVRVDEAAQQASEEEKTTLTATDDVTGAVVTVTGFLPEGLTLVVKHIDTGMVGGLAEGEVALLAVDISLVDAEGNEYEPVNNPETNFRAVSVMISHPSLAAIAEDETLVLYHVQETGTSQVASASAAEGSDTMSFSTGSFSPFIVAVSKGPNTPDTGSDGEVHKKQIKITNLTGETYVKNPGDNITFRIEGGAAPESVSIIDPADVSSGNVDIYKAGYLIYALDYSMSNFSDTTCQIVDPKQPVDVTINYNAVKDAPEGKWAVVFWFKDTTSSGSTRVYMVQYINIVPNAVIKGVGDNYDEAFNTFEVEKCDYDALQVLLTADLDQLVLTGPDGTVYASYTFDPTSKNQKMTVRIDGKDKVVNTGEYFTVSDYYAYDALGHEYVAGKTLKIHDALIKKLPYAENFNLYVKQENHKATEIKNTADKNFKLNLAPGIAVADGLTDYIKGRNTWIKFIACEPIDYDSDGTLAIWIGGQKISHDYYSISNDHKTLWIYRNLLDQLKSNNSYTLTARLWRFENTSSGKVKRTWYPATASFNILAAGSTSYRSPKTGDESNVALWAAVLVLSGGAVIALIPRKKKSK